MRWPLRGRRFRPHRPRVRLGRGLRDGRLTFVSPATSVDRLQYLVDGSGAWISNSLPGLLAAAGGAPDPTYGRYFDLFESIVLGIHRCQRDVPTSAGTARLVYFDNLVWDGHEVREIEKPLN